MINESTNAKMKNQIKEKSENQFPKVCGSILRNLLQVLVATIINLKTEKWLSKSQK